METNVYFKETQRFIWGWMPIFLIMLSCTCLFLYGVIKQVIFGIPFGLKPMSDVALLFCFGGCLIMTLPFVCIRLETRIKEDGVYVKFFPFHLAYKMFTWAEISKSYVKQHDPIQYGVVWVWWLRNSRTKYKVSGNMGLQLEFVSGRRLFIGTNKPKELTETLKPIGKLKK